MLVEVRSVLPLKILEEYYNWFLLLGKVIETAGQTEKYELVASETKKLTNHMIEKYSMTALEGKVCNLPVTSLLVNQLLIECPALLSNQEFTPEYLCLLIALAKNCCT